MNTVSIVAPVIVMILIGYLCKISGFIQETGIENIKKYITGIAIPVMVFHAVGVAEYSIKTLAIFGVMMASLVIAMVVGYLLKGLIAESFRPYFPFMICVYEGGMLCYPLYQNLCGEENFSNIVIVDLAAAVFVFGVYLGLLQLVDGKVPLNLKRICLNAVKSPSFIALVLGVLLGATGLLNRFLTLPVASVYLAIKEMIVAPISPMILICVGFGLSMKKELMAEVLKTIAVRLVVQLLLLCGVLAVMQHFGMDRYLLTAFLLCFVSTPNFNAGMVVQDEKGSQYIATTTSLYCAITIIGYILIASILF